MNPFYFGRSERPLFGLYTRGHSSGAMATAGRGVLLSYPLGSEYLRAHRAFRQLNTLLNREGFHVLRFDWSCTGDSAGAGSEARVAEWLDDADWAIDELLDNAGIDALDVVGLRWGATLAALAAREREEVRTLLLWDPVVSGADYLAEVLPDPGVRGTVGLEGYPFTSELREGLAGIDLRSDLGERAPERTRIVTSDDRQEYRDLEDALRRRGDRVSYEVVPSPGNWAQADPFGDALIPQDIIRAIVDRLQEGD